MQDELIQPQDIEAIQLYAVNLTQLILHSRSETVVERKGELRDELNRVVQFLYRFNINLTQLLTRV